MNDQIEKLHLLIEEGEKFNYENFSTKSQRGYPSAVTREWITWTTKVKNKLFQLFKQNSAPIETFNIGLNFPLIGNGDDKFEQAKSYILGALAAGQQILNDKESEIVEKKDKSSPEKHSNRIFVVHGHDDKSKSELEILLSELGLEPIVLHRQPDEGHTIIEKFEKYSDVGYAFVLLTPDEISYLANQEKLPDDKRSKEIRARPNVIFEFGYFVGRLGRANVCCLYTGDVILPSDISGVLYKKFHSSVEETAYGITKELKARGYQLK